MQEQFPDYDPSDLLHKALPFFDLFVRRVCSLSPIKGGQFSAYCRGGIPNRISKIANSQSTESHVSGVERCNFADNSAFEGTALPEVERLGCDRAPEIKPAKSLAWHPNNSQRLRAVIVQNVPLATPKARFALKIGLPPGFVKFEASPFRPKAIPGVLISVTFFGAMQLPDDASCALTPALQERLGNLWLLLHPRNQPIVFPLVTFGPERERRQQQKEKDLYHSCTRVGCTV